MNEVIDSFSNTKFLSRDVHIGISAYNSSRTIERTIQSLLNQNYSSWKATIIDANSTDNTIEICERYAALDNRIQILPTQQPCTWRNNALRHLDLAEGEFFMWLDADDFLESNWLSIMVAELTREQSTIGAYGKLQAVDINSDLISHPSNLRKYWGVSSKNSLLRLFCHFATPESLGRANLIYSVWRTNHLRKLVNFRDQDLNGEISSNFDVRFLTEILRDFPLSQSMESKHFRLVLNDWVSDSGKTASTSKTEFIRSSGFFHFLVTSPQYELYKSIISKSRFFDKLILVGIINLRRLVTSTLKKFWFKFKIDSN